MAVWLIGSTLLSVNKVILRWAQLVLGCHWRGKMKGSTVHLRFMWEMAVCCMHNTINSVIVVFSFFVYDKLLEWECCCNCNHCNVFVIRWLSESDYYPAPDLEMLGSCFIHIWCWETDSSCPFCFTFCRLMLPFCACSDRHWFRKNFRKIRRKKLLFRLWADKFVGAMFIQTDWRLNWALFLQTLPSWCLTTFFNLVLIWSLTGSERIVWFCALQLFADSLTVSIYISVVSALHVFVSLAIVSGVWPADISALQ